MDKTSLGDRIKGYEKTFFNSAVKRMPLMIRVDGRAFHTFTKHMDKPFDLTFICAMAHAARQVAKEMQGFKAAYVQSDEVTFCLTDYDTLETQGWFNYEIPKITSISASLMSVWFNWFYKSDRLPIFDSRVFNVPKEDVVNAFLWRAKDWHRNSIQMYARSFFSHKELYKKKVKDMHEMLHKKGVNWTELADVKKNGTFIIKDKDHGIQQRNDVLPTYESINEAIGHLF